MFKNTLKDVLYGVKWISLWVFIPLLAMFGIMLVRELSVNVTVETAVLGQERWDMYPDERKLFQIEHDGRVESVLTPPDKNTGDQVEIIYRNGKLFRSVWDEDDLYHYTTLTGRAIGVFNTTFGWYTVGAAAVCLVCFLLTLKNTKHFKWLTVFTNLFGLIIASLSVLFWCLSIENNSWDGLIHAVMSVFILMLYSSAMLVTWTGRSLYSNRKTRCNET